VGSVSATALPPLLGHPGLVAGGHDAAALHVAVAERWAEHDLRARARRAAERAVALDPGNEYALEMLAGMSIDDGEWPRAETLHRALLRARPGDVDAQLRLVAVLVRQAKWADANDALRQARALDPHAGIDAGLVKFLAARAAAAP
jgi:predicted Zn-dependent protease